MGSSATCSIHRECWSYQVWNNSWADELHFGEWPHWSPNSINNWGIFQYCEKNDLLQYASIVDSELGDLVQEIKLYFPMCGNKQLQGHLLSHGFWVQQQRVRDSQRWVDPEGSIMRRLQAVNCRKYQIPSPRSLWHMDGNHKLIRCALANGF